MTRRALIITTVAMLATAAALHAQQTSKTEKIPGAAQVVTEKLTGEVVWVDGNLLVVLFRPNGLYRVFNVPPGREFVIDGQTRHIGDLKTGTILTATVVTTTQPVTLRTTNVLNGTVRWAQGNYVVLGLENGENKEYHVPDSFKFVVEGKPASVAELKAGMKVSATKIVEEPQTEMSSTMVVTGKAPK